MKPWAIVLDLVLSSFRSSFLYCLSLKGLKRINFYRFSFSLRNTISNFFIVLAPLKILFFGVWLAVRLEVVDGLLHYDLPFSEIYLIVNLSFLASLTSWLSGGH